MRTEKYQSRIVKKLFEYVAQSHLGRHYISNGEVAICIPSDECFVDVGKLRQRTADFAQLFDRNEIGLELEPTGEGYISEDIVLAQLAGGDTVRWVKQKNLKPFLKDSFMLLDGKGCVQVYEVSSKSVVAIIVKVNIESYKRF